MHHYGEHYPPWRTAAQQMIHEREQFAFGCGDYEVQPAAKPATREDALKLLVARVDSLTAQETTNWQKQQTKAEQN